MYPRNMYPKMIESPYHRKRRPNWGRLLDGAILTVLALGIWFATFASALAN